MCNHLLWRSREVEGLWVGGRYSRAMEHVFLHFHSVDDPSI